MADPPSNTDARPESREDAGPGPAAATRPGTPRWVKVFGIIALLLLVLVVVMLVAGGGNHGPGRHSGSDGNGQAAPSGAGESGTSGGHRPPPGGHSP